MKILSRVHRILGNCLTQATQADIPTSPIYKLQDPNILSDKILATDGSIVEHKFCEPDAVLKTHTHVHILIPLHSFGCSGDLCEAVSSMFGSCVANLVQLASLEPAFFPSAFAGLARPALSPHVVAFSEADIEG
jgi:hypothetical protein